MNYTVLQQYKQILQEIPKNKYFSVYFAGVFGETEAASPGGERCGIGLWQVCL